MSEFKVPGELWSDPRVLSIPAQRRMDALGLWLLAGCWSKQHRTLGDVPLVIVLEFGDIEVARDLVKAGLWKKTRAGFRFHRWRAAQEGERRKIPAHIRAAVFSRDGHACVFCGSGDLLSLDHIIRYRDNGPDTIDNLRVLCMPCNLERG